MKTPLVNFDPGAGYMKSWEHAEYYPGWHLRSWGIRGQKLPGILELRLHAQPEPFHQEESLSEKTISEKLWSG